MAKVTENDDNTTKKKTSTKHQMVPKNQKILFEDKREDTPISENWHRFKEITDQLQVEYDNKRIPKKYPILTTFLDKFTNPSPWNQEDFGDIGNESVKKSIEKALQ